MKNIWTNGCFDIVHIGHIALLQYARTLGDRLIVGIDSDQRVRQLKGDNRPINTQDHRKKLLESIRYVDEVIIFDSATELRQTIQQCHIDTIVVGDDYLNKDVIGAEYADVVFFSKIPQLSTSSILRA